MFSVVLQTLDLQGGRRACHTTVLLQHQDEQRSPHEVVEPDEADEVLSLRGQVSHP